MAASSLASPLDHLLPTPVIHERIGQVLRELALLRRMLRLRQAARDANGQAVPRSERREAARAS